eukprot:6456599-Amphidinium_carterae.1
MIQKETKLKEQSGETLKVLGRRLSYDAASGSWAVDCEEYVQDLRPIEIGKTRRQERSCPITADERSSLLSLIQSLAWPARVCMPQMAYLVSKLQQLAATGT